MRLSVFKKSSHSLLLLLLLAVPAVAETEIDLRALLEKNQQQMLQMRQYSEQLMTQMQDVNETLQDTQTLNQQQADRIRALETELKEIRFANDGAQKKFRQQFFKSLKKRIATSPVLEVKDDRIIIFSDHVYVHGTGELGAEGHDRLNTMAVALKVLSTIFPKDMPWRLRVEGHTDIRPLRNIKKFNNNWALSAARAVSMLRFLEKEGLPEQHLLASGYAATRLLDKSKHRLNRRVEIHLQLSD